MCWPYFQEKVCTLVESNLGRMDYRIVQTHYVYMCITVCYSSAYSRPLVWYIPSPPFPLLSSLSPLHPPSLSSPSLSSPLSLFLSPPPPPCPLLPLPPQYVPRWVAPNLLTFTGWLMVMFNFALLTYYDPDYLTSYNTVGVVRPPIPRWVWLFCGVSHFTSYTLDGIDGKQARRTKSATPLGELLN